eukprot:GHVH01003816.1.p3 GENE.GHVH01003816.1~~GHVH01003816.1.p3  ORF type:complete len:115 (-),score=16.22 GHVH01003816.1:225-569(-)
MLFDGDIQNMLVSVKSVLIASLFTLLGHCDGLRIKTAYLMIRQSGYSGDDSDYNPKSDSEGSESTELSASENRDGATIDSHDKSTDNKTNSTYDEDKRALLVEVGKTMLREWTH